MADDTSRAARPADHLHLVEPCPPGCEEILTDDSILWECTNCYNCHERCPQEVKPVEVIISMKNMLADRGIYPRSVDKIIKTFEATGRTTPGGAAVDRFGTGRVVPVNQVVSEMASLIHLSLATWVTVPNSTR